MSDVIHLLPDSVANQIAAGEVIQRPASVIKELVENAVDAGATTIHVVVVDAGRTSIQVIDDGKGMSETDARLSFERHATSKIAKADDLFALHTMGFRGEALASIAAVAHVELQTRREADEIGSCIRIAGSKVVSQEPVSCPVGSNFKVENLFFNVPARRKFLKSNATELSNILTAFERIVLVYPDIHFTLHHNGTEMLNLKTGSLLQRISDVFGRQYSQDLLPVEVHTAMCSITGFISKPEGARKKSGHDYFFVNGRYMKHPYFHKAVVTAYDRLIPEGMQVPYFLYFEVNPNDIDVKESSVRCPPSISTHRAARISHFTTRPVRLPLRSLTIIRIIIPLRALVIQVHGSPFTKVWRKALHPLPPRKKARCLAPPMIPRHLRQSSRRSLPPIINIKGST